MGILPVIGILYWCNRFSLRLQGTGELVAALDLR